RQRTGRRFTADIPMKLIAKAEGRGKRAPKAAGKVLNISLGGACIQLDSSMKMKKEQEFTLALTIPDKPSSQKKTPGKGKGRGSLTTRTGAKKAAETKIKATVAWTTKGGQVG